MIQVSLLAAVQGQPAPAVTATLPLPPGPSTCAAAGAIDRPQETKLRSAAKGEPAKAVSTACTLQ